VAACAAPLVGWLAQTAFAFQGAAEVSADKAENQARARALGSALLTFTAVPWTLCVLFFTGLHFTYWRDRDRATAAAVLAAALEEEMAVELVGLNEEGLSDAGLSEEGLQLAEEAPSEPGEALAGQDERQLLVSDGVARSDSASLVYARMSQILKSIPDVV